MSTSLNEPEVCDELIDIKPDISVLCHEMSATVGDSLDVKPEITCDNTPTTSCKNIAVQSSVQGSADQEEYVDHKPLACTVCHYLPMCDERLHQKPLVLIDEFDITKFVYPIISKQQACNLDVLTTQDNNESDKPYICMECDVALESITKWKLHTMHHVGQKPYRCTVCRHQFLTRKQLLTHSTVRCLGR